MKTSIILVFLIIFSICFSAEIDTLYILQTTDIHGNLFPFDYFSGQPADRGLAKIHTKILEYRSKHKNVVLVDCGDLIQGTPLTYYFNHLHPEIQHPVIQAMNIMEYDAFAVGNHDIEQGRQIYQRCRNESDFPWLSANSLLENGSTFFDPYVVIERDGLKIGIIGLTTPAIPMWLNESLYAGITWQDMVSTAEIYSNELRPHVDILIGIFHSGFDETDGMKKTAMLSLPIDNASGLVAENVKGFDAIFGGHSHNLLPVEKITISPEEKPLQIVSGLWGNYLGIAEIIYRKENDGIEIISLSAWLDPVKDVEPSSEIMELSDYHEFVMNYVFTGIGIAKDTLNAEFSRMKDTALVELINKAQMDYADVDISVAACFDTTLVILPGEISVKDVYSLYPYENFLYVMQLSGRQIKEFLEYSARYFQLSENQILINPQIKGYNFDIIEGIDYSIDLTQKEGKRINGMILSKTNKPLQMDEIYDVAMNSYRANGGGGHIPSINAQDAPIISRSSTQIRNILLEYITKTKTITSSVNNNWSINIK